MCQKRNSKRTPFKYGEETKWKKVDKCLSGLLCFINANTPFVTLGSCCGHGRYSVTIVCKSPFGFIEDICSGKIIPRKKRFYVRDSEGYYYIPEIDKINTSTLEKKKMFSIEQKMEFVERGITEFTVNPRFRDMLMWLFEEMDKVYEKQVEKILRAYERTVD